MKIHLTRDSVCAADDLHAPHLYKYAIFDNATYEEICLTIIRSDYLPKISGGQATWSLASVLPIAVIAQQWSNPKLLNVVHDLNDLNFVNNILKIHVNYHAQIDPELVYEVFWGYDFMPIRK